MIARDPIHLPMHTNAVARGVDPRDARRQLHVSLWLIALLSLAMVAVIAAWPAVSDREPTIAKTPSGQAVAAGRATIVTR
jgi:hypothetical protein